MRLIDAVSRSTKKARNEKKENVLHCPDCGGKIESVGQYHGLTVYNCTVCHKKWI